MNIEDQFLSRLLGLQYGENVQGELKKLSKKVSWAKNWPENKISFWNAEAFMWSHKISKEKRDVIKQELIGLKGRNLDLGCGSYSYLPSIGLDISKKMLDFNDSCREKIVGDLEQPLPIKSKFDSVTAIFVLNYIQHYQQLLDEITRVLRPEGVFVMVLSNKSINDWQKQKEINNFSKEKWLEILTFNFVVNLREKENLLFFVCRNKRKPY